MAGVLAKTVWSFLLFCSRIFAFGERCARFRCVTEQASYADHVANNSDVVDTFPARMERFLDCISQVYFLQDSLSNINSDTGVKQLMRRCEADMASKKEQSSWLQPESSARPWSTDTMPGVDK